VKGLSLVVYLIFLLALPAHAQGQCAGQSQVVLFLDLSEPLDQPSEIAYNTLVRRVVSTLPSNSKLSVYTMRLNAEDISKSPDYEKCVPDFESMKGAKFKARSIEKFEKEVIPKLESVAKSVNPARRSPILENIYKIAHKDFHRGSASIPHTLIVVSDLIQFSDLGDFYTEVPNFSQFMTSPKATTWMPFANGVSLHLILLNSPSSRSVDQRKIREFWLDYSKRNFKLCGFSGINQSVAEFKNGC